MGHVTDLNGLIIVAKVIAKVHDELECCIELSHRIFRRTEISIKEIYDQELRLKAHQRFQRPVQERTFAEAPFIVRFIVRSPVFRADQECLLPDNPHAHRRAVLRRHIPLADAQRFGQASPRITLHQKLSLALKSHNRTPCDIRVLNLLFFLLG